jgi:hypothetical protein
MYIQIPIHFYVVIKRKKSFPVLQHLTVKMSGNGGADPPDVSLLTAPEIPGKGLRYSLELRLFPRTGLDVVANTKIPLVTRFRSRVSSSVPVTKMAISYNCACSSFGKKQA